MKKKVFFFLAALLALFAGQAEAQVMKGNATYYAHRFHGRRTSSGERYHKDSMTCAHRTLPFGTLLKVRNVRNGKEVVVRVTDRGPFRRNAILDLSYAAAKQIGMIHHGIVKVEAERIDSLSPYVAKPKTEVTFPPVKLLVPDSSGIDTLKVPREIPGAGTTPSFNNINGHVVETTERASPLLSARTTRQ